VLPLPGRQLWWHAVVEVVDDGAILPHPAIGQRSARHPQRLRRQAFYHLVMERRLSERRYVSIWVDGVQLGRL